MEIVIALNTMTMINILALIAQLDVWHVLPLHNALVAERSIGLMVLIALLVLQIVILVRLTQHVQLAQLLIY